MTRHRQVSGARWRPVGAGVLTSLALASGILAATPGTAAATGAAACASTAFLGIAQDTFHGTLVPFGVDAPNISDHGQGIIGTDPSVAGGPDHTYQVAYVGANRDIWTVNSATEAPVDLGVRGTAPSVTALVGGGYEIAYVATDGTISVAGTRSTGSLHVTGFGPKIGATSDGSFQVVWWAPNDEVWTTGPHGPMDLGVRTEGGVSLAELPGGGYEIAYLIPGPFAPDGSQFHGSVGLTGTLGTLGVSGGFGTSGTPGITALPSGKIAIAWSGVNGAAIFEWSNDGHAPRNVAGPIGFGGSDVDIAALGNGGVEVSFLTLNGGETGYAPPVSGVRSAAGVAGDDGVSGVGFADVTNPIAALPC